MDAQQIAERHVVERYLAGQLSETEALAFEAYVEAHPEIIDDIEEIARMKAGLAMLKRRGELPATSGRMQTRWYRHPGVLAASLVAVVAAFLLVTWPSRQSMELPLMAATIRELAGGQPAPVMISQIALSRTRAAVPQQLHASPQESLVEVTLEMFAADSSTTYSAELLRFEGGVPRPAARVDDLRATGDGSLVVYLREDSLAAGYYLIRVSAPGVAEPSDFVWRLVR